MTAVYRQDLAFHDAVCRLSGNGRLHEVFARYVPMLRALLHVDERMQESLMVVAEQHRPSWTRSRRGTSTPPCGTPSTTVIRRAN